MKTIILLAFVSFLLISCDNNKRQQSVLLGQFTTAKEMHPEWETLFTEKYSVTPLETKADCLIGQIDKIKKMNRHYYILSSNGQSIFHFNEQGKFVSSLNKMGQGPEEYHHIEDFDVYEIDGQMEVWVSDNTSLKVYDASDFTFKYKIAYPFIIHKFRRLESSHILLITGQNENILTLTDKDGNIISEYLKKEIPFIMFRPVQFVAYKNKYLFQLGISNSFVLFNPQTETFQKCILTEEKSYLSETQLLDMFNRFGTDFIMEANKGSYINNILSLNDVVWIQTSQNGENYITKVTKGQIVSTVFSYGSVLSTITTGDSDDSILLYITPDQISDNTTGFINRLGSKIDSQTEDNPYILEFFN